MGPPAGNDRDHPGVAPPSKNDDEEERQPVSNDVKPHLCQVCGRFAETQWHSTSADYETPDECAESLEPGGVGYWLCADLCHKTAHDLMAEGVAGGGSAAVIAVMIKRLADAVETKHRTYRKGKGHS